MIPLFFLILAFVFGWICYSRMKTQKMKNIFARIAVWQPKPYIGYCKDSELSRWFYKKYAPGYRVLVTRNKLGTLWSDFWWYLACKLILLSFCFSCFSDDRLIPQSTRPNVQYGIIYFQIYPPIYYIPLYSNDVEAYRIIDFQFSVPPNTKFNLEESYDLKHWYVKASGLSSTNGIKKFSLIENNFEKMFWRLVLTN